MPVEPRAVPVPSVPPAPSAAPTAEADVPVVQPARTDEAAPNVEALADRIADLAARIQAATYELLVLIRQFDERDGWEGFASCAHWLSWRIGLAPGAAREKVRVAHALAKLPRLSEALQRGAVSYSKVRAVTRVATPATEQALLDVALAGTAAHVEQVVRTWRRVDRAAEQTEDRRRHESRALHTWVDDDGMFVVRGRLTPEVGAVLRRALDAALDAGAKDGGAGGGSQLRQQMGSRTPRAPARRRRTLRCWTQRRRRQPRRRPRPRTQRCRTQRHWTRRRPMRRRPMRRPGRRWARRLRPGRPPTRWPRPSRSGGPMRWGWWPSARWPAGSTRGRPATATKWSCTSTPTPWRTTVRRAKHPAAAARPHDSADAPGEPIRALTINPAAAARPRDPAAVDRAAVDRAADDCAVDDCAADDCAADDCAADDCAADDCAAASRPGESPAGDGAAAGPGPERPARYVPAGTYRRRAGEVLPRRGRGVPRAAGRRVPARPRR